MISDDSDSLFRPLFYRLQTEKVETRGGSNPPPFFFCWAVPPDRCRTAAGSWAIANPMHIGTYTCIYVSWVAGWLSPPSKSDICAAAYTSEFSIYPNDVWARSRLSTIHRFLFIHRINVKYTHHLAVSAKPSLTSIDFYYDCNDGYKCIQSCLISIQMRTIIYKYFYLLLLIDGYIFLTVVVDTEALH